MDRAADRIESGELSVSVKPSSRNYVVFDDKLIDIERKYGRAAEARAAGEAPHPDAVRAAIDAAQRITGNHVRIETYDADHDVFRIRFPDGHEEQVFGYTMGRLLRAAVEPGRTAWNLNHEAVHALEALGVFKPGEMRALEAAAQRGDWMGQNRIAERYPDLNSQQQMQEAIAEQFARYSTEPRSVPGIVQYFGRRIAQFLERLRNVLAGNGFRSADDVFSAMQRGEVGAREPAAEAPSLAESQAAAGRFEAAQGKYGRLGEAPPLIRGVEELIADAHEMRDWRDWYDRHVPTVRAMFGDDAGLFQKLLSATSQAAKVDSNVTLALRAYDQLKRAEPFKGYLPAVIKNLERIRENVALAGQKIGEFEAASAGQADRIAVDRHIAQHLFGVDRPTPAMVRSAQEAIQKVADAHGWTGREAQAALWAFRQVSKGVKLESLQDYASELEKRADAIGILRSEFGNSGGAADGNEGRRQTADRPPQAAETATDEQPQAGLINQASKLAAD
jgi:hypothetical protein